MEKMQLGSPSSPGPNTYLPNFLMGIENSHQTPTTRNNFSKFLNFLELYSKNLFINVSLMKNISILANSPTASPDFGRNTQHKLLSGLQSPGNGNSHQNAQQQQQFQQNQNAISGPPTTSLFDYLKNEKSFQTPTRNFASHQQSFHDTSALNQSGFNQSRIMSPILNSMNNSDYNNSYHFNSTVQSSVPVTNGFSNFWVTVFGFPQSAVTAILSHFSQCGTILEKVCSSGNWIHLRFSSRMECDKAILYNGKIICNNLMVGVSRCTDTNLTEKENDGGQREINVSKIRSLTQAAYKSAQEPTEVVMSPNAPKRTTGIINKTLDMFFGW